MEEKPAIKQDFVIVRTNPNNVSPIYTNDMSTTFTERELFITFSLIEAPQNPSEYEQNSLNKTIDAKAVAKLVLTPEFAQSVLNLLNEVLSKYKNLPKK